MIIFGGSPHHGSAKVADEAFGDALLLSLLESLFHLVNVLNRVNQSKFYPRSITTMLTPCSSSEDCTGGENKFWSRVQP